MMDEEPVPLLLDQKLTPMAREGCGMMLIAAGCVFVFFSAFGSARFIADAEWREGMNALSAVSLAAGGVFGLWGLFTLFRAERERNRDL